MKANTNNHSCENCEFFFQHYGWYAEKFRTVKCGHCLKRNINKKDFGRFPFDNGCEEWQPKEKEIAKRKERLKKTLTDMAIKINDIINLLDEDFLNS